MPVLELKPQDIKQDNETHVKRNYIFNTADGAVFALGMGMVPLDTVLTYFISKFVEQKLLIGLLTFLNVLLTFTPQILVSRKLERLKLYKPFLIGMALVLRALWLLMGINVLLFADSDPVLFTVLFYLIYSLIGLTSAFTNITWLNFIVKIIPQDFRGRFLGIRSTIAGVFEATGALLMGYIVKHFAYPVNYGVLFLAVGVLTFISLGLLSFSKENESVKQIEEVEAKSYLAKMKDVLTYDRNFTSYLVSVALIGGFGKMAFAFQIVFAKERLGIVEQQVSYAAFILLASQTVGYLIWGLLGDRYGFKRTLEISALIFIPTIFLVYLMSNKLMFYFSMGLFGIAQSARNVNENNLAINLCRAEEKQPLYIGLRNLLMGPVFALNPVFAGLLYDFFGRNVLFPISAAFMLSGFLVLFKYVKE